MVDHPEPADPAAASAGLTAQLANIIELHCPGTYEACKCHCGFPVAGDDEWAAHVAAVITEQLDWKQEWGSSFVHSVGDKPLTTSDDPDDHDPADGSRFAKDFYRVSRWVSPWKPTP